MEIKCCFPVTISELQSDWGQKGKKEGFTSDKYNGMSDEDAIKASGIKFNAIDNDPNYKYGVDVVYPNGETFNYKNIDNAKNAVIKDLRSNKIPLAPFVTNTSNWTKLLLKYAIREAVRDGATKVTWESGDTQFERWGSEKISWKKEVSAAHPDRVRWKIDLKEQTEAFNLSKPSVVKPFKSIIKYLHNHF